MTIKQWLFSFQGRISRQRFWMWNLFYYLVMMGLIGIAAQNISSHYTELVILIASAALLFPDLAVTAKRWHDRNKSNRWLLMHVPLVLGRLMVPTEATATSSSSSVQLVVSLLALICGIWMLIECGFMKGTQGENQYGAEPE